jgi:hypothetical protein
MVASRAVCCDADNFLQEDFFTSHQSNFFALPVTANEKHRRRVQKLHAPIIQRTRRLWQAESLTRFPVCLFVGLYFFG